MHGGALSSTMITVTIPQSHCSTTGILNLTAVNLHKVRGNFGLGSGIQTSTQENW